MNKISLAVLVSLTMIVGGYVSLQAMGNKVKDPVKTEKNEKLLKAGKFKISKLAVDGMTCGGCERTVASALEGNEGFIDADISFKKGEAVVRFDPKKTTAEKLAKVIQDKAGYKTSVAPETEKN